MLLRLALVAGTFSAFMGVGISWSVLRVQYPAFLLVKNEEDFLPTHQFQEARILEVVPVLFLNIVATLSLFWLAPADQRIYVSLAALALLISLGWSIGVQIPTHLTLDKDGFNGELLTNMLRNEWVRFLAVLFEALAYSALLFRNL
ncbi:MAG: hypothetical protein ACLQDV_25955 [Candidatus Binataceae bacterium]